ncbi:MAG: hypothetical protein RIB49_09670, partial [Rhodospirillales bacterium]
MFYMQPIIADWGLPSSEWLPRRDIFSAEAITAHLLRRGLQGIVNDLYQLVEINICCDPVSRFFGRREGAGDA